ncbi:MAG: tetratricopeptide repeat protein [Candidatus Poribacteria bacterium]|nr:tetratricopeptide repeat protein [Candidatus Poribacteria bacterium]
MKQNKFPPGWDEERVQKVIDYYENQTEDEAVAEAEEAFRNESMNDQSDSQNDLSRVLEKIQEIVEISADGDYIFRGEPECYEQAPYYGKVSSNLYRALLFDSITTKDAEEYYVKTIEPHIAQFETEILKSAKTYLYETDNETISDFEILAQLQHYGCRTNLIDFTTDYLIALFFACDRSYHKDGRVILQKRESEDYQSETPSETIKRVESQKSVLIRSPKGFINPDVVVVIPKELKLSVLNYLDKYHDISTKKIYKDVHGFIKWLGGYFDPMLEYGKGVIYQNRANLEDNMQEKLKWYEKAYEHFTEALKLRSDFTEVYIHRGAILRDVGKLEHALKDFNTAIDIDPDCADSYNNRGMYYAKKGDTQEALKDFKIAIDLDSENADFYNSRGITYKDMEEVDLAIQDYSKAIELDPELPEAYNNLGVIYDEKGEHDKAIENYTKAIELRSCYANAYSNRGCAYLEKGDIYRANEDFFSVAILQSDYGKAFYYRGVACSLQKKWEEARANFTFANNMGIKIFDVFHNDYKSIKNFEKQSNVQLPEDLAAMLKQ